MSESMNFSNVVRWAPNALAGAALVMSLSCDAGNTQTDARKATKTAIDSAKPDQHRYRPWLSPCEASTSGRDPFEGRQKIKSTKLSYYEMTYLDYGLQILGPSEKQPQLASLAVGHIVRCETGRGANVPIQGCLIGTVYDTTPLANPEFRAHQVTRPNHMYDDADRLTISPKEPTWEFPPLTFEGLTNGVPIPATMLTYNTLQKFACLVPTPPDGVVPIPTPDLAEAPV